MFRYLLLFFLRYGIVYQLFHVFFWIGYKAKWGPISWAEWLNSLRYDYWTLGLITGIGLIAFLFWELTQKGKKKVIFLFHTLHISAICLSAIDLALYAFSNKRLQLELFLTEGIGEDIGRLITDFFMDYWWLVAGTIFLLYVVRINSPTLKKSTINVGFWVSFVGLAAFSFLGIRGGWQLKPLSVGHAGKYVANQNVDLVLNSVFTLVKSAGKPFWPEKSWQKIRLEHSVETQQSFTPQKNVLILIVESLGRENLNAKTTPFLFGLSKKGSGPEKSYANGTRSIEAVPSIIGSIPHLFLTPWINSSHSVDPIHGFGTRWNNCAVSFYHGGRNGTMGFEGFAKGVGVNYFGLDQYTGSLDAMGKWGIHDYPYLQYVGGELGKNKGSFVSTVFTLSSHHPFTIPSHFPPELKITGNPLQQTLRYADWAVEQFFGAYQNEPWFQNTLFVVTGDHTSLSESTAYQTPKGKFAVPIFFYSPTDSLPQSTNFGQHQDIALTVERLLGDSSRVAPLASDIFGGNHHGVFNLMGTQVVHWKGEEGWQRLNPKQTQLADSLLLNFVSRVNTKNW